MKISTRQTQLRWWSLALVLMVGYACLAHAAYQIQVGDHMQILVMGHPDYTMAVQVRPDGHINYFSGAILAEGLTPEELADALKERLTPYIPNPIVTVAPTVRADAFFVLGEVAQPGQYDLPANRLPTLLQAIATAGGLREGSADASRIELLRADDAAGQFIDLRSPESRVEMQTGDVIWVHRLAWIQVLGQVQQPGGFFISQPVSVPNALALAGGSLHDLADTNKLRLYRADQNTLTLDLQDSGSEVLLSNGDVLYVPHAYQETKVFVLGYVHAPGSYEIKHPLTPLEAIALGGGAVEERADIQKVRLIRADGTLEPLNLQEYYEGNVKSPMLIYPGDTIQVPGRRQINWSLALTFLSIVSVAVSLLRQ